MGEKKKVYELPGSVMLGDGDGDDGGDDGNPQYTIIPAINGFVLESSEGSHVFVNKRTLLEHLNKIL